MDHASFPAEVARRRQSDCPGGTHPKIERVNTISVVHPDNVDRLAASFDLIASLDIRRIAFSLDHDADRDREAPRSPFPPPLDDLHDKGALASRPGLDRHGHLQAFS